MSFYFLSLTGQFEPQAHCKSPNEAQTSTSSPPSSPRKNKPAFAGWNAHPHFLLAITILNDVCCTGVVRIGMLLCLRISLLDQGFWLFCVASIETRIQNRRALFPKARRELSNWVVDLKPNPHPIDRPIMLAKYLTLILSLNSLG